MGEKKKKRMIRGASLAIGASGAKPPSSLEALTNVSVQGDGLNEIVNSFRFSSPEGDRPVSP